MARHRESAAWRDLADGTRRTREKVLQATAKKSPDLRYGDVDRALIVLTRDSKKDTPASANNFLDTMRGLFNWAFEAGFVAVNPTAGVKGLKLAKTGGFRQWTEEDIAAFCQKWPVGTRERLALEILLNTGLWRGDAARLGKQHIRNGRLRITTQKTGTLIDIPIGSHLEKIIAASPTGDLALVAVQKTGNAMTNGSFGNWFQKAAEAAGVKGNAHGLRKAAAVRLAEAGSTIPEMNAVFGWTGSRMAMYYIERASRKTLADNAAARLVPVNSSKKDAN